VSTACARTPDMGRTNTDPIAETAVRLEEVSNMDRDQLIAEWRKLFRSNPLDRARRELLELGVAWKLQEKAFGGMRKGVAGELRRLGEELDATGDIRRAKPMAIKPGARILREWNGVTHEVMVLDDGFAWNGQTWKSLTAIAGHITGAHWSGPRFFGLKSGKHGETTNA